MPIKKGTKNPNMARKGKKNPFYGKSHSDETKRKISEAGKGRKMSEKTKEKMREVFRGNKSYMFGKPKSQEIRKKLSEANKGRHPSEETRRKMSDAQRGEKGSNWRGGISFESYTQDWRDDLKDSIRKRDNYVCQICGMHQSELNYKLHCHHIDYNKKNCNPRNLIVLCRSCHMKTNFNREYWTGYFNNQLYG